VFVRGEEGIGEGPGGLECRGVGFRSVRTASVQASPKPTSSMQEAKPEKKIGNRIIKREIR
jgi:hypothetical protein